MDNTCHLMDNKALILDMFAGLAGSEGTEQAGGKFGSGSCQGWSGLVGAGQVYKRT